MKDSILKEKLLLGGPVAENMYSELLPRIKALHSNSVTPCLRVILVGTNPASQVYVRMKAKKCKELGVDGEVIVLPEHIDTEALLNEIDRLNKDTHVHGILVQLPLPSHIDTERILSAIDPIKDVDGFHEVNVGKLQKNSKNIPIPCTANAVLRLLQFYSIETAGKHIVMIGRSPIVGRPLSQLLSLKRDSGNATITLCHSRSKNVPAICSLADIIIVAIGIPKFLKEDMIRKDAIIIDVGINRIQDSVTTLGKPSTHTLVGDADFENILEKCSRITPVPRGIGVLTIASLMYNTVQQTELQLAHNA